MCTILFVRCFQKALGRAAGLFGWAYRLSLALDRQRGSRPQPRLSLLSAMAIAAAALLSACGPSEPSEQIPAKAGQDVIRLRAKAVGVAAGSNVAATLSGAQSTYLEAGKLIRANESVTALDSGLFGDRVNLYMGELDFLQTDVSVPGNSSLRVAVARHHRASGSFSAYNPDEATTGHFGDWDLDLPRVHGVFSASSGWQVVGSGSAAQRRCTYFGPPPAVTSQQRDAEFIAEEYWHGSFVYIPGQGSQEILKRNGGPVPTDGQVYNLTTSGRWQIRCLASMQNGSGEGFVAVLPDGTQYRFDWMVSRPYARLYKAADPDPPPPPAPPFRAEGAPAGNSRDRVDAPAPELMDETLILRRREVWILPTEVRDRFGNTVEYEYDRANPWKLLAIKSVDGQGSTRRIGFTYTGDGAYPRIATVRSGSPGVDERVWNYSYRNTPGGWVLANLTLPDGISRWTFNLDGLTYGLERQTPAGGCDPLFIDDGAVGVGTITHPSGATGVFTIRATPHGRSDVFYECYVPVADAPASGWDRYPKLIDRLSIVAKSITGPGLPVSNWTYEYGAPNDSWAPCNGCSTSKTVTVTDPEGDRTRYTFGNQFRKTEGQLEKVEEGLGFGEPLRKTVHIYKSPGEGPWPDPIGFSSQTRGNGELASRHAPLQQKVITQQGTTFTWSAAAFEQFGKPVRVTRSSSLGFTRTEEYWKQQAPDVWVLGYHDNINKWVIGLTEARKTTDGVEIERYEYDAATANRMKAWANWQLRQSFAYYADGTLSSKTDAAGKTTSFANYKRGLAQSVGYADGTGESAVVDDHGQVASVINAAGTTTAYEYDTLGRLKKITYPGGDPIAYHPTVTSYEQRWATEYGLEPGHWRQTVSTGYAVTQRYFDAQWRPRLTRTWDTRYEADTRRVVVTRYDTDGRKTFESYPQRADAAVGDGLPGISSSYDALGRIVSQTQTGSGTTSTAYLNGFRRQITNPRNFVTTQEFQAFDEPKEETLTRIVAPEGVTVTIQRDAFGKALSITRAGAGKSVTRSYVYDGWQRLCKTIEPETGATVQYLDAVDNIAWRASGLSLPATDSCDHGAVPDALKISFSYDNRHRLLNTTYPDGSQNITRGYTPDGLLAQITTQGGGTNTISWAYSYNNRRLLSQEVYTWGDPNNNWTFQWGIDAHGHVASLTDPWPWWGTMAYAPNALGQPTQVGSYATGVTYHPNGAVAGYTLANGVVRTVTQNSRGLPELWRDSGPGGTVVQDRYAYDANGNVTSITDERDASGSRSMPWYDGLDRLRQANGPWGAGSFEYDALDNLVSSTVGGRSLAHNFDDSNRLIGLSGSQNLHIGYDPNGNITNRGAQSFVFDIGNRMTRAPGKALYAYDGHGRRNLVWFAGGDYMHQAYTQDGKLRLAWRHSEEGRRHVYLGDQVIAEHTRDGVFYLHTDALGSPVAKTNSSGAVVSRTRYEPYGATVAGTTNPTTIGFTGHVNDADTGLVYMQQRYYEPLAGRFLSVDPIVTDMGSGASFNRYAYAANSPYTYTDPDGRNPKLVVDFLLNVSVNVVTTGEFGVVSAAQETLVGALNPAKTVQTAVKLAKALKGAAKGTTVGRLRATGQKDAHHVIQDAAVRDQPGYSTNAAPGIQLAGPSNVAGTPHNIATAVQRQSGGGTYAAERRIGYKAMRRAGVSEGDAREAIGQADDYFKGIGVGPNTVTRIPGNR